MKLGLLERLKNNDLILESEIAQLNQDKKPKQIYTNRTFNTTVYTCYTESLVPFSIQWNIQSRLNVPFGFPFVHAHYFRDGVTLAICFRWKFNSQSNLVFLSINNKLFSTWLTTRSFVRHLQDRLMKLSNHVKSDCIFSTTKPKIFSAATGKCVWNSFINNINNVWIGRTTCLQQHWQQ